MVAALPIELLQLIFRDTPQESLRNCRLVDHQWSAASTPLVFDRVHASLFSRSLNKFTALCHSPLAKHVKAIDFHTDQLPGYTRKEWEDKVDLRVSLRDYCLEHSSADRMSRLRQYDKIPRHTLTPVQVEAGWQKYQGYHTDQRFWRDSTEGEALRSCFAQLRNLKEVIADRAKSFDGSQISDQTYWRHFKSEILIGPEAWSYQQEDERNDEFERLATLFVLEAVAHRQGFTGFSSFENLSVELPRDYAFRNMIALSPYYPFPDQAGPRSDKNMIMPRYAGLVGIFKALKHLKLFCPSIPDISEPVKEDQVIETSLLLTNAKELRSLQLEFGEPIRDGEDDGSGKHYVDPALLPVLTRKEQVIYPHLQEFKIGAAFNPSHLTNFLLLHKQTLRRLELKDCLSSQWDLVLSFIGRMLNLEHVYIESLWGCGPGEHTDEEEDELDAFESINAGLRFGEGLNEDEPYVRDMKAYLLTGEGPYPMEEDYMEEVCSEEESDISSE